MTRGERVIAFIERYCRVPEGAKVGEPVKLLEFQKKFILAIYDNPNRQTRRAYLSIARKNGKTALIAFLLLVHLIGPEAKQNSQIVSGARSRDQAAIVFKLALKIINFSPELRPLVRDIPSTKILIGLPMNVEFKAMSADAKTAHGGSPALAILDEVGQVRGPVDEFIEAIETSQGAYEDPLLLAISTQAPTDADLFSVWLDDAKESKDPTIVSHVYAADQDADIGDKKGWKAANPALNSFRNYEDLKKHAEMAERMPSAENKFRNLYLNQRVSLHSPYISRSVWEQNGGTLTRRDGIAYGGLDLSVVTDLTAFVLAVQIDGKYETHALFWTPKKGLEDRAKRDRVPYDLWVRQGYLRTTEGSSVDYAQVGQDIYDLIQDYQCEAIAYDRFKIEYFQKDLAALGLDLPLQPWGQGYKDMSPAVDALEAALLDGEVIHENNPVMNMCAANAVIVKDPAGNRKLDKSKSTGRIDGIQAMAQAFGIMSRNITVGPSVYSTRGALIM